MKAIRLILLWSTLALAPLRGWAADPVRSDISLQGTVVGLPKAQALQFTTSHHLDADAEAGFKDLQELIKQRKAEVAANPAITTKNGQRATSQSGITKLDVEAVLSPAGDRIDTTLQLSYQGGVKINTGFDVKNGAVKYLGAFDADGMNKDVTYLVFVHVSASGGR